MLVLKPSPKTLWGQSAVQTAAKSEDKEVLNSTFTVEVGVAKPASATPIPSTGMAKPGKKGAGQLQQRSGRGIFSRNKSPSKIPSYLKTNQISGVQESQQVRYH